MRQEKFSTRKKNSQVQRKILKLKEKFSSPKKIIKPKKTKNSSQKKNFHSDKKYWQKV